MRTPDSSALGVKNTQLCLRKACKPSTFWLSLSKPTDVCWTRETGWESRIDGHSRHGSEAGLGETVHKRSQGVENSKPTATSALVSAESAIYLRSVCRITTAFHGLRCHPLTCMLLNLCLRRIRFLPRSPFLQ